jgi:protein TonB
MVSDTTPNSKIEQTAEGKREIFYVVEEMPEFPKGQNELFKFLAMNIQYPASAREAGVQGTAFVQFIVEADGSISNVATKGFTPKKVKKATEERKEAERSLSQEAEKVIRMMPRWKSGKHKGKAVPVCFMLPIKFNLG